MRNVGSARMARRIAVCRTCAAPRSVWVAALIIGFCLGSAAADARPGIARPNIVLIVTDDADVASHAALPKTKALIADQGTTFANFFVTAPLCCPSRASILRGQYAHNTGIVGNMPPSGGFEKFQNLGLEDSTLATWLRAAGYHTAMVGKYLNGYVPERDGVPPGWQDWYVGGNAHRSYNYTLNENGRIVRYDDRPEHYLNDVLTAKAVAVIRRAAKAGQPFFLYVLPYTPHSPSVAAPRHAGMFAKTALPRTPAFNEADVGDKPALIRSLPLLDQQHIARLEDAYRRRLRSLQAIDDMVARLVDALTVTQQLDHTYVVYSSDNGFHLGAHRLPAGKNTPYEEDIRVPMVMRGPGVPAGHRIEAMVLNIDLALTFAAIAGIEPPDFVDGRSFLPLFQDPDRPWRRNFLIELAARQGMSAEELDRAASFTGLRTADDTYVEYAAGERELYDLRADPFQLNSLAERADPALLAVLSARLAALAACVGAACRHLEDLSAAAEFRLLTKNDPGATVIPTAVPD